MTIRKDTLRASSVATSPAYSEDTTSTWRTGPGGSRYSGDAYSGIAGTDAVWGVRLCRLRLTPGTYTAEEVNARVAFSTSADWAGQKLLIGTVSGGTFTLQNEIELSDPATPTASSYSEVFSVTSNGEFTIEDGGVYFWGLAILGATGRSSTEPGWRTQSGTSTDACYSADLTTGGVIPSSFSVSALTSGVQALQDLTFTAKNRVICDDATSGYPLIPTRVVANSDNGITTIKLSSVVVADGNALTINADSGDGTTRATFVLDFGATDQITAGGNSHALTGQAGDTFDLLIQYDATNGNVDLLYLNRTDGQGGEGANDIATISHACKQADARDTQYSISALNWWSALEFSGTATIGAVEVGWQPVVIFGDSMASFSGRLGQTLPTAFTYDRMYWRAQISGNQLTTTSAGNHTSGLQRFKNDTIGNGDLIEIRDPVFVFAMYGLNDISSIGTTIANYGTKSASYFTAVSSVVTDVLARGGSPLVMGLAPYHKASEASALEADAIQFWNEALERICKANRVAWVNPWWSLVDPTTLDDPLPEIASAYDDDGGVHINTAGATLASQLAVQAYESGFVYEMGYSEGLDGVTIANGTMLAETDSALSTERRLIRRLERSL